MILAYSSNIIWYYLFE